MTLHELHVQKGFCAAISADKQWWCGAPMGHAGEHEPKVPPFGNNGDQPRVVEWSERAL